MDTIPLTGRADLTDAQWAVLEPPLPEKAEFGRPPKWTKRQLIDGVRWRTRVGAPWRECAINRIKRWRAVATRYDKLAVRFEATVHIAVINEWL